MNEASRPKQLDIKEAPIVENKTRTLLRYQAVFGAILVSLLIIASAYIVHRNEAEMDYFNRQVNVEKRLNDVAGSLASAMRVRLNLTSSLRAFVTTRQQFTAQEFDHFGQLLQKDLTGVLSLQLAPGGIVTYLTNHERNKKAVGHNLLADPNRRELAEKSIRENSYIIAGPIDLVQGGQAIIARRPIFLSDKEAKTEAFWGFATILIDINELLLDAAIDELSQDYDLAIRGKNGLGAKGDVFLGSESTFTSPIAMANIPLPNASWQIAVAEKNNNEVPGFMRSSWYWVTAFILAFACAMATYTIIDRPRRLNKAIKKATENLTREVNHRKDIEEKVRYMAQHDPLTGLPNRRLFDELSNQALAKAKREQTECVLLFIDIDEFKAVNDSLGHSAGDLLLKMIAQRLKDRLRKSDIIARYGGDEFVAFLTENSHVVDINIVASGIVSAIAEPFNIENNEVIVGASVGIAIHPRHGDTINELVKKSDDAMYMAKDNGKNTYQIATS